MKSLNIKNLLVLTLLIGWLAPAGAQSCTPVSSDTTVTTSCSTGIAWTGGDLTIGNGNSILITNNAGILPAAIEASGINASNLSISEHATLGDAIPSYGFLNDAGSIVGTLNNMGLINASSGTGIWNVGTIQNLNNNGVMLGNAGANGIYNEGSIYNLNNYGSITTGVDGIGIGNANTGTIDLLNNYGTITGNRNQGRIDNGGVITTLNNYGSIVSSDGGYAVSNAGVITNFLNSGSITATGSRGIWNQSGASFVNFTNTGSMNTDGGSFINDGAVGTFNNAGSMRDLAGVLDNTSGGTFSKLINSGSMSVGDNGSALGNEGTIISLINSGSIIGGSMSTGIGNSGTISTLINSGLIALNDGENGIYNSNNIITLINSGSIKTGTTGTGIYNDGGGTITTLTNSGSISPGVGSFGIINGGVITTLNNSQGGNQSSPSTTALSFSGNMPTNYNIGFVSPTHYGQLTTDFGSSPTIANVGIYGTPLLTARTYASVLLGDVTVTNLQNKYDNMTVALVINSSTNNWDMTFTGISLMGTQQSLVNTANSLAPVFTLQNAALANSFSYDCTEFGINNVCISAGGRNTAVSAANGLNNTSALLITAYRPHPNYRIGAYADQNLSVNNTGATVNLSNNTPLIGIFGAWNERLDGAGTEVKISAAYGQKNTTINRQAVGLGESGTGSSQLNSQGAQVVAKYGFNIAKDTIASPYLGMRYTQNNMNGYSEAATTTTTLPLTYSALNTNATTALIGVGASYKGISQTTLFASAGIESDTNTSNGSYYGSNPGIPGITPVNFNPNPVKTRPTATLGAYYDVEKNQRIGVTGIYRQEPYQAVQTTTVMATYTVGL